MDKQRNRQRLDEHKSNTTSPNYKTQKPIERHAAAVYTREVFYGVQKEISKADQYCAQWNVVEDDTSQLFTIRQKDKAYNTKAEFKVLFVKVDSTFSCSCQMYEYFGILCCHIFSVLSSLDIQEIPSKYVNRRWRRGVIPIDVLRTRRIQPGSNERSDRLTNDIQFEFDQILSRIYGDDDKLELCLEKVRQLRLDIAPDVHDEDGVVNKHAEFEKLLGVSKPNVIEVRAPDGIRNKGCGTGKRMIGGAEKAINSARLKRKCRGCNKVTDHDSRNCPIKKAHNQN